MSSALYRFTVPPTSEQGSHVGTCRASLRETYRQNALSDYNSARAHDGLPPLARMPRGTRYSRIKSARPVVSLADPRFPHVTTPKPNAARALADLGAQLRSRKP